MGSDIPRVSVVIVTNGRPDQLRLTIAGLERLDHDDFELIIVVGPDDAGVDAVRAEAPAEITWRRCPERNAGMARNIGIAAAWAPLVAFIDDDAIPDPGWLDQLEAALADPEVTASGGMVFDHTGGRIQTHGAFVSRSGRPREFQQAEWVPGTEFSSPESWVVTFPMGSNVCFRRSALIEIGGYDERFAYYHEDADIGVRLVDHGHLIRLLDHAFIYHGNAPSERRDADGTIVDWTQILTSMHYFAGRHGMVEGMEERTRAEVARFVNDVRWMVAHDVVRFRQEPEALERLERSIVTARERAAGFLREVAAGASVGGLAARIAAERHGPSSGRFPSWGARRAAAGITGPRPHVCVLAEDDHGREAAVAHARALEAEGVIARVLVAGGDRLTVTFDAAVWHHMVPAGDDPAAALNREVRRIDAMRTVDDIVGAPARA